MKLLGSGNRRKFERKEVKKCSEEKNELTLEKMGGKDILKWRKDSIKINMNK